MSDPQTPPAGSSPLWDLALGVLGRMPSETKQAWVDTVANTLQVRPGFWAAAGEKETDNAAALLDFGEARYALGFWNGTEWRTWKNAPGNADEVISQPVKRWAVIPG